MRSTAAGGARRPPPRDSYLRAPSTPSVDTWQQQHFHRSRDSDASFCSARASSSTAAATAADKHSAVRAINAYLSAHNAPFSVSLKPLPSAKTLTDILGFLLGRLEFNAKKLEDDLPLLLRYLNCPHKMNKSALKSPAAPHSFPTVLAVMHWLVQLVGYFDHVEESSNSSPSFIRDDVVMVYALESYIHYMRGDDNAVQDLDAGFNQRMEKEAGSMANSVKSMDDEIARLEGVIEGMRTGPSERERCESERKVLEGDVRKFEEYIASLKNTSVLMERALEEKEKELAAKVEEKRRICEENEELKKRVEGQGINLRDAERMRRELQAVDREISQAEADRSTWEEKCWDVDAKIGQKFKELQALSMDCNQALRRLKIGSDYQYALNPSGSTPVEVLGIDYKSTIKPALNSYADEIKKSSVAKLEELIALQQQSKEMTAKIEGKRNHLASLQSHIDDKEAQLNLIRKEIQDYTSRCAAEARKMREDIEAEDRNLNILEREALETLKAAQLKLEETKIQSEGEIQMCAYELFALIDSVSRYKEHMELKISEMKKDLSETVEFISDAYKNTLSTQFNIVLDAKH